MHRKLAIIMIVGIALQGGWPTGERESFRVNAAEEPAKPSAAADAGTLEPAAPAIRWERRGATSGRALIFIPALAFNGNVWENVYKQFESQHPIYVVTIAGADGVPPTKPPYMQRAVEDLREMIQRERLDHSVIVGHLIGFHMGLRLAGQYPDLVGGVAGIPHLVPRFPPEVREEHARLVVEGIRTMQPDLWEPTMRQRLAFACRDVETIEALTNMAGKMDRENYAGFLADMTADMIEQWFPKVRVPVLMMTPITVPTRVSDPHEFSVTMNQLAREAMEQCAQFFPDLERCDIRVLRDSRQFVMYEQPNLTARAIRAYMSKLDNPSAKWETTVQRSEGG
jgi:pimeloyl-ACP methyl ester carboxylesterase